MDLDDISEKQAKEILLYLAKRSGASAMNIVTAADSSFYLTISLHNCRYVLNSSNNWTNISIPHESQTPYLDFLKKFLELSSKNIKVDIFWINNPQPFLKARTSLEQILIEMDLAA